MSDDTLWSVHVQGGDEYHAMASREDADAYATSLDGYDKRTAERLGSKGAYLKPLVKPWPYDAESHAAELAENKEG